MWAWTQKLVFIETNKSLPVVTPEGPKHPKKNLAPPKKKKKKSADADTGDLQTISEARAN